MNKDEKIKIGEKLMEQVQSIFPINKKINYEVDFDTDNLKIRIWWKLNNDQNRPHKYSKIIIIEVTQEDLECLNDDNKKEKFYRYINEQYKNFDPNHDNTIPPIETWFVSSSIC